MKFVYIDESGTAGLNENATSKEFFVLSGMMVEANKILVMEQQVRKIKQQYGLYPDGEFKWNASYAKNGLTYDSYQSFRHSKIDLIKKISDCVIAIAMDKKESYRKNYINDHLDLYKQALYLLMERFCMYLNGTETPVVFVIDSRKNDKNAKLDDELALAYKNALRTGTYHFKEGFPFFSETAFFTTSEDSAGLQLADYCAGPIKQYFETKKSKWYERLRPALRKKHDKISGYGIKQFPTLPQIPL